MKEYQSLAKNGTPLLTLDITDETKKGEELALAIEGAVRDMEGLVIRPMPNAIKMTRRQFEDQAKTHRVPQEDWEHLEHYTTPKNAMEIIIDEAQQD